MPLRDLDKEQKNAAISNGGEVVISAGAGSGKTMLLVGRYLYLLKTQQVPMPSIVAITFTNKAADQMKARITQKARELAETDDQSRSFWLEEVAAKMQSAVISTIHSFCNTILRSYPLESGLDPLYTIIDDTTLAELKRDTVAAFIKERLETKPERIEMFIEIFGMAGYKQLLRTMLRERVRIIKYLDENSDTLPETLEKEYLSFIHDHLDHYLSMLKGFHALRPGDDSLSDVLDALVTGLETIREMAGNEPFDPHYVSHIIQRIQPGRKGSPKKWGKSDVSPVEVRGSMKKCIGFLENIISFFTFEKGMTSRIVSHILEDFSILETKFLNMKKNRSYIDHDDTLIETWRLLRKNVNVRQKISQLYKHILVDEFQDTDSLQMDIIRMIAGNTSASLFTVGDPKQSIYRFRGADVTIFNKFKARQNVDYKSLKMNYRSTPGVVGFVNHTFSRIMGVTEHEHYFEADYSDMKANRKGPVDTSHSRIAVFDGNSADASRTAEADFIARHAAELRAGQGYSYSDMALILRKGTQSACYERAFLKHNIPFVNLTQGNPFTSPEAYDIAHLLGWLCEPDNPHYFTGLLFSPFFSVSADFLYSVKLKAGKSSTMPEGFLAEDYDGNSRGSAIQKTLRELLFLRERITIRELLETAFSQTGYTMTVLADPLRGELSLTILDHILREADTFESQGGSVSEFSRLLLEGELYSEKNVTVDSGSETLTMISIHKAKGMEYKVVFLADISSRPSNSTKPFMIHDKLGIGIDMRDTCGKTVKTLVKNLSVENEAQKDLAESKRLFYVGCTRAEDRLIISGGKPSKTPDDMFEKDNWMGWLHTALSISPDGEYLPDTPLNLFTYSRHEVLEDQEDKSPDNPWEKVLAAAAGDFAEDRQRSELEKSVAATVEGLLAPLPGTVFSGKPATLSPTQVMDYLSCPAHYLYKHVYGIERAQSGQGTGGLGAQYGSFAHRVLRDWDFSDDIRALSLVDELAGKDIPSKLKKRLKDSLRSFSSTELYRSIQASDEVRREEPFGIVHDDVFIRGTIDVLFKTDDGYCIVDYKTDKLESEDIESAAERYRLQLGMYALALYRTKYVLPSRLTLYFLTPGITHEIQCDDAMIDDVSRILSGTIESLASGDYEPKQSGNCEVCVYSELCGE